MHYESECGIYLTSIKGAMAQLVARLNGIQKVSGSNPLSSTIILQFSIINSLQCTFSSALGNASAHIKIKNSKTYYLFSKNLL
jgi:hypothetical protein